MSNDITCDYCKRQSGIIDCFDMNKYLFVSDPSSKHLCTSCLRAYKKELKLDLTGEEYNAIVKKYFGVDLKWLKE